MGTPATPTNNPDLKGTTVSDFHPAPIPVRPEYVTPIPVQPRQRNHQTAPPMHVQPQINVTVPRQKKYTNHVFHAFMTVITGGLWGIVWLVQTLRHNTNP